MAHADDPKDPTEPKSMPVPSASKSGAADPADNELSDEELGKVSGGRAQISGRVRGPVDPDVP